MYVSYGCNNRTQMLRVPGPGASRTARSTARATRTWPQPPPSPPGSTGSSTDSTPATPTTELNLHELTERERAELGVEMLPATLLDATRELAANDVMRAALGTTSARTTSTTTCGSKQREFQEWHDQVTQWEVDRYLQLF